MVVVASISETMQFCRHVRAFLRTHPVSEARRNVALSAKCLSLSVLLLHISLCPPVSVSPMLTRSLAVDLVSALSLIVQLATNHV